MTINKKTRFGRQNFEKILDDDERKTQDLTDKILKKILDDDERKTQDLTDKILKKFWMTMNERSERKGKELKMKKESKKSKNVMKTVKILTIIFLIVLVSMVGFFGIYKQNKNQVSNVMKDYSYAMDINGSRTLKLTLNSENGDDLKTEENYKTAKNVIEKRLKKLGVGEYKISLNEQNGEIIVQIPENTNTDTIVSNLTTVGKFEILDSETNEVLLDNSSVKSSGVLYNTTTSGTSVYLEIAFDENGKNKLEEISKTYVKSENNTTENTTGGNSTSENTTSENKNTENTTNTEETNTTSGNSTSNEKKITMKIDDEEIMSTSFDEAITTGKIQLSVGKASTDTKTINGYVTQAQNVATVLDSGKLPVKYDTGKNQYILSNITNKELAYVAIAIAVVVVIGLIVLIVKYKVNGLLAGISYIGLTALYGILLRYTNVTISVESLFAIAMILLLNYIFIEMILKNIKEISKETTEKIVNKSTASAYVKFFNRIVPICVMVIAFCFAKWVPMSSFGMTAFWGLVIIAVYNAIVTRYLLKVKVESK